MSALAAMATAVAKPTPADASVLEPIWDIAKKIVEYLNSSKNILNKVKAANRAVFIDIEMKLEYVKRMINKLAFTYEEIRRQIEIYEKTEDNEVKLKCVQVIYRVCIEICTYERNLSGTRSDIFDKYRDELAMGKGSEYRFAFKFYNIFDTLLMQSRFGLNGILHAAAKDTVSIDFMLYMLGKVSDAYVDFFDDFGKLVREA